MEQGCLSTEDMQLLKKIGIITFYFTGVDYAIDRIRKKYSVFISVIPAMHNSRVCYNANIRYALPKRMFVYYISTDVRWNPNIYEVKRRAIRIAAKWILAHKCKKISIKSAKK
jgi:hypothetical protein